MLRGRIHFPLGMIEPHVAGLTGLGRAGFFDREGVARVAGIALCSAELRAGAIFAQLSDFSDALVAKLVASTAALLAFRHCHRLPVNCRHGFHGSPRHGMLAFLELRHLRFVALSAGFRSWNFGFGYVGCGGVLITVTGDAGNFRRAVLAELPVGNNVRRDLGMALDTLAWSGGLCKKSDGRKRCKDKDEREGARSR